MTPEDFAYRLNCLRQAEVHMDFENRWAAYLLRESLFPATREGMQRALLIYTDAIDRGDLVEAGRRAADIRRIIAAVFESLTHTKH